jgi:hypothetical protein
MDGNFHKTFYDWMNNEKAIGLQYEFSTSEIIAHLMQKANHYNEIAGTEFLESAFR